MIVGSWTPLLIVVANNDILVTETVSHDKYEIPETIVSSTEHDNITPPQHRQTLYHRQLHI